MKEEKHKMTEIYNSYGIIAYLIIIISTFIVNIVLSSLAAYIHIIIFLLYVLTVLFSTFHKNINPILDIADKKLVIGFLLVLPICISILCDSAYFWGDVQESQTIWDFLNAPENALIIFGGFFLIALVCYIIGYAYSKINVIHSVSNDERESKVNDIISRLDEAKINEISNIKDDLDSIKNVMREEDINNNYNNIRSILDKLDESEIGKITTISDVLESIKDKLLKENQVAYTVTCIPIKYDAKNKAIKMLIIKNESHEKYAWMFPGCHIEVANNHFIDNNEVNLKLIDVVPNRVILEKVKEEVGLNDISLLDPNFELAVPNGSSQKRPRACWIMPAPVFNYLFLVSDASRCYKHMNHRCHYDFTYIGEYKEWDNSQNNNNVIEIELRLEDFKFDEIHREADIIAIKTVLQDSINKSLNFEVIESINNLCLDSVPQMIYNASMFYKNYKKIN